MVHLCRSEGNFLKSGLSSDHMGPQESKAGHQAWWQPPVPTEPVLFLSQNFCLSVTIKFYSFIFIPNTFFLISHYECGYNCKIDNKYIVCTYQLYKVLWILSELPGVVMVYAYNSNTQGSEVRGSPHVQRQPCLHSEFKVSEWNQVHISTASYAGYLFCWTVQVEVMRSFRLR